MEHLNIEKYRGITKQKFNEKVLKIMSLFLLAFMGLRHLSIGADTSSYCKEYLLYKYYSWNMVFKQGTNYAFYVFNKIISILFPDTYVAYLFIVALISVVALYHFLKKNADNVIFSEVLLFSLGFIYFFMTGIKQTLAISILLYAYEALKKDNIFRYILLVLLATLFHNTALVFIVALFIKKFKFKKIYLAISPVFIVLAYKYQSQIFAFVKIMLQDKYYFSYGTVYSSSSNLTGLLIQICIFATSLILLWRRLKYDKEATLLLSLYTVGMCFQAMTFVLGEFFRVSMYFSIFGVILLPKAMSVQTFRQQKFISFITCLVFILYFLFFSGNDPNYIPYHFFWEL